MNTKETQEIVRKLVVGSAEIDRMKKEIDTVVKMILGLIEPICTWREYDRRMFLLPDLGSCWEIVKIHRKLEIKYLRIYEDESLCPTCLYFVAGGAKSISYKDAEIIHITLPTLIEGIEALFPGMSERWHPFINAAEAVEKK